jgi:Zn finger protein HypA/HybF involved in hydrogenase expression
MHEVSIMQSALEMAERHARAQGATRIHRIVLKIGAGIRLSTGHRGHHGGRGDP